MKRTKRRRNWRKERKEKRRRMRRLKRRERRRKEEEEEERKEGTQGTRTGCLSVTGHNHNHTHIYTTGNVEMLITLPCMALDWGGTRYLEETPEAHGERANSACTGLSLVSNPSWESRVRNQTPNPEGARQTDVRSCRCRCRCRCCFGEQRGAHGEREDRREEEVRRVEERGGGVRKRRRRSEEEEEEEEEEEVEM
ncbi:hypothetical protein QTP86_010512 [Hemibagrus guttatus]|nr:hypothetical protein QTP86_010512 [Hemibagrus guttatus]